MNEQWVVKALDITLATIGGYSGLVWMVVHLLVGKYSSFKLSSSMVNTLYQYQEETKKSKRKSMPLPISKRYLISDLESRKTL